MSHLAIVIDKYNSYMPILRQKFLIFYKTLWPEAESNCRPLVFQTSALPTELSGQLDNYITNKKRSN